MIPTIPDAVQKLLEVFLHDLADVRFPDVDAPALTRAVEETNAAAEALAAAEAAVDAARGVLADRQDALLRRAQRALAYARVYAEGNEELAAQLEPIILPRAPRKARADGVEVPPLASADDALPRRRGRPRKDEAAALALDLAAPAAE